MIKNKPKEGDLKVYWYPQIPCKAFYVPVKTPDEAALIMDTLARYDAFQFEERIKPDYCNAGGLMVYERDYDHSEGYDWCEWYSEDGDDIREWMEAQKATND